MVHGCRCRRLVLCRRGQPWRSLRVTPPAELGAARLREAAELSRDADADGELAVQCLLIRFAAKGEEGTLTGADVLSKYRPGMHHFEVFKKACVATLAALPMSSTMPHDNRRALHALSCARTPTILTLDARRPGPAH